MNLILANCFSARRCIWLQNSFPLTASLFFVSLASCTPTVSAPPLDGKLNVLVRPPDRTVEPISVREPGALPVKSDGAMYLDVQLNQPAYVYLVWIDSAGKIQPLYPWNNELLEITDVDQTPPERRPVKLIFSPLLGKSWSFHDRKGAETVLLLARRTPLPKHVKISLLLKGPAPSQIRQATDVVSIKLHSGATRDSGVAQANAKTEHVAAAMPIDGTSLSDFLHALSEQFDFVEAIQFAHEDAASTP
jgi:hypothetical protein